MKRHILAYAFAAFAFATATATMASFAAPSLVAQLDQAQFDSILLTARVRFLF